MNATPNTNIDTDATETLDPHTPDTQTPKAQRRQSARDRIMNGAANKTKTPDTDPDTGSQDTEIALTPTASALRNTVDGAAGYLVEQVIKSMDTMTDRELFDNYVSSTALDTAAWLLRTKLAATAYGRIKTRVAAGFTLGEARKADSQTTVELKKVCDAMGIGVAVFMYDVRMYVKLFDRDNDSLEGIPSGEMIDAVNLLRNRSYFQLASDCALPRRCVREIVNVVTGGGQMTAKIAKQIKDRITAEAKGTILDDTQTSVSTTLLHLKKGSVPDSVAELLCGIHNAYVEAKTKGVPVFLTVSDTGEVKFSDQPGIETGKKSVMALEIDKDGKAGFAGYTSEGYISIVVKETVWNNYAAEQRAKIAEAKAAKAAQAAQAGETDK